jgi:acetylornithine aminotransferase
MMDNYGTPPIALVSGGGAVVTDADGKSYVDLLGGIAVNVLGHRHPAVIEAVTRQLNTLGHTSNLYATEPGVALAEALVAHLGADAHARVFFANSGTEANEAAFKISRLTGRTKLVAAEGAFHGRTMGYARSDGPAVEAGPRSLLCPADVTTRALRRRPRRSPAAGPDVTPRLCSPSRIHGGGRPVGRPARRLPGCRRGDHVQSTATLLVLDEVQTGIGPHRSAFYAHTSTTASRSDIVTLAKGSRQAGCRSARASRSEDRRSAHARLARPARSVATLCDRAALAVLKVLADDDLIGRADVLGKTLQHGIEALGHPLVDHVRGRGLLRVSC